MTLQFAPHARGAGGSSSWLTFALASRVWNSSSGQATIRILRRHIAQFSIQPVVDANTQSHHVPHSPRPRSYLGGASRADGRLIEPVLDTKVQHPAEFVDVAGDDGEVRRGGVRGDQHAGAPRPDLHVVQWHERLVDVRESFWQGFEPCEQIKADDPFGPVR